MPLTPNNREEHWLQGMVDGQTTLEPNKRREYWYKEIVDAIGSGGGGGGGTGGGVLVCNIDDQTGTLDKTWQEIFDADFAVLQTANSSAKTVFNITSIEATGVQYNVHVVGFADDEGGFVPYKMVFSTNSATGFPTYMGG